MRVITGIQKKSMCGLNEIQYLNQCKKSNENETDSILILLAREKACELKRNEGLKHQAKHIPTLLLQYESVVVSYNVADRNILPITFSRYKVRSEA